MNLNTSLNAIPAEIKEQFRLWRNAKRVTPLLTRLYVYSIIFDPFLFFIIADRITVGFSLSVSRLFMFLFYGFWFFRLFRAKAVTPFVALNKYWILFMLFFAYVLVFNFLSFLLGENYMLKLVAHDDDGTSDVAIFLAYPYVRLCLELASFCLTIFHYFWVGPRMLIKRDGYYFLCSSFLLICYISFAFGLINYSSALLLGQNIYPRHLAEYISSSPSFSGVRFQGLAGEPRDAFVQLVLFFVLFKFLCVVGIVNLKHSYVSFITLLTFTCLVLTISASGLFGVAVFGILFAARQTLYNFSLKNIAASAVLSIIVVVILAVSFEYID